MVLKKLDIYTGKMKIVTPPHKIQKKIICWIIDINVKAKFKKSLKNNTWPYVMKIMSQTE